MENEEDQKSFVNLFHFLMDKTFQFFNHAGNHGLLNKTIGFNLDKVINFYTCFLNRNLFSEVYVDENISCHVYLKPLETESVLISSTCEVHRCKECYFLDNDRIVTRVENYLLNTKLQGDQLICLSSDVFNFVQKPLGRDLSNCIDRDNSMIRRKRAHLIIQNARMLLHSGLADKRLVDLERNKGEFVQKQFGSLLAKLELVISEAMKSAEVYSIPKSVQFRVCDFPF
eukprot:snap_masked-scaffold_44-processed-gene-1.37-mRNA-1 protein AED:1.00 eAED:1.00 QI:0/0/0/0/1/1/2/0/227